MVHLTKDPGHAQMVRKWMEMEMKQIRKDDWHALNRREGMDGLDLASWIIGILAALFCLGAVVAQFVIHFHHVQH